MNISRKIFFFILFFIIILTRLPAFQFPILDIDESDFLLQASVWFQGGIPYVDFVEKKPPVIHAIYALAMWLGGPFNMTAVHLLDAFLVFLTALLIFFTAKEMADEKTGWIAAILYALFQSCYDLNDFLSALTETPMNLFSIAALLFFLRRFHFTAGVCLALACLSKQVAIALFPVIVIWNWKNLKATTKFLAGFALPIFLLGVYLKHLGAWDDFLTWTWQANLGYMEAQVPLSQRILHGLEQYGKFIAATFPLWLLVLPSPYPLPQGEGEKKHVPIGRVILFVWLLSVFPMTALGWRFFPHYFLQLLPPLVLLASLRLASIQNKKIAWGFLALPALFFFFMHFKEVKALPQKNAKELAIGEYLRTHSKPDEKLFVWGHSSDVYFYAERLPATRFVYCSYLIGAAEGYEEATSKKLSAPILKARQFLLNDFEKHSPQWIVDMSGTQIRGYDKVPIETFPELTALLRKNYAFQADVEGAKIYHLQTSL